MFTEENLLQLSGLQHLSFCPRRWGLVHLEGLWEENILTMEGKFFHEKADEHGTEVRVDTRIARGLRLRSLKYGLSGKTDVVEFHRTESNKGIKLKGVSGLWVPFPVEYKSGSPKTGNWYEVQLCAQALCLEECFQ